MDSKMDSEMGSEIDSESDSDWEMGSKMGSKYSSESGSESDPESDPEMGHKIGPEIGPSDTPALDWLFQLSCLFWVDGTTTGHMAHLPLVYFSGVLGIHRNSLAYRNGRRPNLDW
jgi:hypothetical protein